MAEKPLRILYSHFGREGREGWGRSFYMAKALANLGNEVVFLTTNPDRSFWKVSKKKYKNVQVITFPDFLPGKLKSKGFGTIGLLKKLVFSALNKFDIVISDCGHRPSGLPCKVNRIIHKSTYLSEWWDYFGEEGYYKNKPFLFKLLYGWIEKWSELNDKRKADGVIVLSSLMKERALSQKVKNVEVIPGGSLVDDLKMHPATNNSGKLNFGYLGMGNSEISELEPFLEALSDEKIREKVKFIAYGKKISPEYIKKYKLQGIIEERGWINYLQGNEELSDIDIFVLIRKDNLTSKAGWPNKLGDYLALGRPVMIFPYGDLISFVKKFSAGFITVKYESNDIVNKIYDLVNNEYNFPEMGSANRTAACEITWENRAAEIINFHKKVSLRRTN